MPTGERGATGRQGPQLIPQSVGATPLLDVAAFPEAQRRAAQVAAEELHRDGEDPAEFYARAEPGEAANVLVLHLWHQGAFAPEHRGVVGNPGGQNRDFHYDSDRQQVTKKLFWQ
jgi:hypothetical protein